MSGGKKPIDKKLLLASASPRRAFLLQQADIDFRHEWNETDEHISDDLSPQEVAIDIAYQKYLGSKKLKKENEIILTADTIVVFDNKILGKPNNQEEAFQVIQRLSGESHTVITGVVMADDAQCEKISSTTEVIFNEMSDDEILYYIDKYQPLDKAGSYGIQEWIGWSIVKSISGSYSNIMGLPVSLVYQKLKKW